MQFLLERFAYCPWGTYGQLFGPSLHLYTVERPWLDNARWLSCIPIGVYELTQEIHHRFGWVLRLHNVRNRDGILIHVANTPQDVQGCIAVGRRPGFLNGQWGVTRSREAMELLRDAAATELNEVLSITARSSTIVIFNAPEGGVQHGRTETHRGHGAQERPDDPQPGNQV